MVAVVPAVDNEVLLDVNVRDGSKLEGAVGLDEVERVGIKRKLRKLQKTCRVKR